MPITLYERLSASQAFYQLITRVVKEGTHHKIGRGVQARLFSEIKTTIDMVRPLVGMKGLDYGALTTETLQLVDRFFDSEPQVIHSLLNNQTEVYYWTHDYILSEITFLIRQKWVHLKVEVSVCNLWEHFPSDVFNLSLLAAKICLLYHQHTNIKLYPGRLDLRIKNCFVSLENANILKECLRFNLLNTPPLDLEPYYRAPPGERWEWLIKDLKKGKQCQEK